jgi:hypothetical protein
MILLARRLFHFITIMISNLNFIQIKNSHIFSNIHLEL